MVIEQAVLHIMDIDNEAVIFTDQQLDLSEETIAEYLYTLTEKVYKQDAKYGNLDIDHELIQDFFKTKDNFIDASKKYIQKWHDITRGMEIPTGDYLCVVFAHEGNHYIGLLKLLHNQQVTHYLDYNDVGIINKLIVNRTILPKSSTKLKEAIIFDQQGYYHLIETKYKVEGEKQFYLGEKFLNIDSAKHTVTDSLKEVKKIVQDIAKNTQTEDYKVTSKLQEAVYETVETGYLDFKEIEDKVFNDNQECREQFAQKIEEKKIVNQEIKDNTPMVKKYSKQKFKLDNGIEISIPMEVYQDKDVVEFINQPDGTLSVLIKNIDEIENKF